MAGLLTVAKRRMGGASLLAGGLLLVSLATCAEPTPSIAYCATMLSEETCVAVQQVEDAECRWTREYRYPPQNPTCADVEVVDACHLRTHDDWYSELDCPEFGRVVLYSETEENISVAAVWAGSLVDDWDPCNVPGSPVRTACDCACQEDGNRDTG